jgi:Tol biopolymer transport system component
MERLSRALTHVHNPDPGRLLESPQPEPAMPPRTPAGSRIAAATVALLLAAASFALATSLFRSTRAQPPSVAVANGQIAVAQGPDADIVLLDPKTGASTPLVERHQGGNEGGLQMAWSPDGSKLAYTDYRANDAIGLFVLELSSGDVMDASGGFATADSPAWSPDGTRIAFTGCECASGYEIYVVGADGEGLRTVTDEPDDGVSGAHMPAWSPDGTRIAYAVARYDATTETERSGVAIIELETNEETVVTDTSEVDQSPTWSPDGTRIAFIRYVTGTAQILVANADGTGERLVVRDEVDHIAMSPPLWSPDGTRIVFGAHIGDWGIWLANANGSGPRAIIEDAYAAGPVWAPDGSLIAFVGDDAGRPLPDVAIRLIGPDGSGDRKLAAMKNVSELAWQPVLAAETTPSQSPTPPPFDGSIFAVDGSLAEGRLLVQVDDRVELLEAGAERSRLIGDDLFALDLSPDGSRALLSTPWDSVGPETALVSLDLTSGERTLIADLDSWGIPARWSPDGSSVAVRVGERNLLCVRDLSIEVPRCFPELGRVYEFDWSPDGTRIVFEQGLPGSLTILDVASGQTSVLVRWDDPEVLDAVAAAGLEDVSDVQFQGPRWSPSGRYVGALGMVRTGHGHANMVLVFDLTGGIVARGVPFHEFSEARGWSPTTDVFAYASGEPPYQIDEVRLLDVSTGEDRLLISTADFGGKTIQSLVWSPSGRWVAVTVVTPRDGWFVSAIQILDATGVDPPRTLETTSAFPELVEWGP